ncbi:autotransporter domain-containing protein [Altererythrobacter sp. Z27]|uniref:autotransporter domain-containing protein n=1 Tax=Altererythrobacter sp. Z27 TaxID=3461147 RepID=UPI004044AF4B
MGTAKSLANSIARKWHKRPAGLLLAGSVLAAFSLPLPVLAQVVIDNGDVETVKGDGSGTQPSPWDAGTGIYVGDTNTGTLAISDGGVVNSEFGTIGLRAGSDGTVTVDGIGSTWALSQSPYVGHYGTGRLTITNGGLVTNNIGTIGYHVGSDGTVTVDGAGSQWTNAGLLRVGYSGVGHLAVTNGGNVNSLSGFIGYNAGAVGSVLVDGAGSTLANSGQLTVGRAGTGSLTIANGGTVSAGWVAVAQQAGSVGTINIGAAVGAAATGAGTIDAPLLTFGNGSGTLVFNHTDSAYIFAPDISGKAALEHYAGDTILTGQAGYSGSTLLHGGTLEVSGGGSVFATYEIVIAEFASDAASLVVSGANGGGSVYLPGDYDDFDEDTGTGPGYLFVGARGTGNLTIANGGTVNDLQAYVGTGVGSEGTVTVDGAGSAWTNRSHLHIGWLGSGSLAITNGGTVTSSWDTTIGSGAAGSVSIDGAGSSLSTGGLLFVGDYDGGTLSIANGGSASAAAAAIGYGEESFGSVTIAGTGSKLEIDDPLFVGLYGSGELTVSDGATVNSLFGYLGNSAGSDGTATVDGAGSAWAMDGNLFVGLEGRGSLAITNGGSVSDSVGYVGSSAGSSAEINVDGIGSIWTSEVALDFASLGNASLAITNGGTVATGLAKIGAGFSGVGEVLVDGPGSSWINAEELLVADGGTGSLILANGGSVSTASMVVAQYETGVGAVNIGAAAGEAAAAPGTINVPTLTFGDGTGTLVFNHTATDYAFDPVISGTGTILHRAGYTSLTADSSVFTGTTDLAGGTLNVAGSLGGVVNVSGNGTLVGTGSIGSLALAEGGTIAPGNSIGTINVAGNVTFDAGSVFAVEVDPSSSVSDLIAVAGTATLNGGTVTHVGMDGEYAPASTYTILTATGGVTGEFSGATSDFAFLAPVLGYTPNAVTLTLLRNSTAFGDVAQTYNQLQVAGAIEEFSFENPVVQALLTLDENEARAAFDGLSGEIHAGLRTALAEDVRLVSHTVVEHMVPSTSGTSLWAELIGSWSSFDKAEGTAKIENDIIGLAGGAQFALDENIVAGFAVAYTDSDVEIAQRHSTADVQSFHLMGYFTLGSRAVNLSAGVGYAHSTIDTRREASFPAFDELLSAKYNGETLHAFAEIGHEMPAAGGTVEPFARFTLVHLDTDGFTETGGDAALSGVGHATTSASSLMGAHYATSRERVFRFAGTLAWQHVFSGYQSSANLAFDGGLPFEIVGANSSRNAGVLDLSAGVGLSGSAEVSVNYRGLVGNFGDRHALTAGVTLQF